MLDAVVVRLGRLPECAAALARAVAVLGEAPLPLAADLADLDAPAEEAADTLAGAHLLGPGEPLAFVHPLMAGAVLADLPPLARARAHRRAAELLDSEGAGPERVAGHLLGARPRGDRWTSGVLRAAARASLANAEADSAVRLLRRALDEPPPTEERDATLVELAQAEAAADSPDAAQRLVQALDHVSDRHRRAEAYHELARLVFFKGDLTQAANAAERGLREVEPGDELASRLLSASLTAATFEPSLRAGHRRAGPLPRRRAGRAATGGPADLRAPVRPDGDHRRSCCRGPPGGRGRLRPQPARGRGGARRRPGLSRGGAHVRRRARRGRAGAGRGAGHRARSPVADHADRRASTGRPWWPTAAGTCSGPAGTPSARASPAARRTGRSTSPGWRPTAR